MIALLVGYEYALAAYRVTVLCSTFLESIHTAYCAIKRTWDFTYTFFPYKCRIMNKLEVLELTGGSVMLSKHYISFASWTVPTTKMKEVDPLPNFFFCILLLCIGRHFAYFICMNWWVHYCCYLMKFYCVLFRKVVSWLCWNRFFSSCDNYSTRRGKLEW